MHNVNQPIQQRGDTCDRTTMIPASSSSSQNEDDRAVNKHDTKHEASTSSGARCGRNVRTLWIVCAVVVGMSVGTALLIANHTTGRVFSSRSQDDSSFETTSFHCFATQRELETAVDTVLENHNSSTDKNEALNTVYQLYGPSLSSWCVDRIQNFSDLFSAQRNPNALHFNTNLNGWNVSSATHMERMFYQAAQFDGNLSSWDTSKVISFSEIFRQASSFQGHGLEFWDTSSATDLSGAFWQADSFRGWVADWNVSSVVDLSNVFRDARAFVNPVLNWDTSSVTTLSFAFSGAESFDGELGSWNTSQVTNMEYLFFRAFGFIHGNITHWDVSNVENMAGIFRSTPFQGDISRWNTFKVWNALEAFKDTSLFNGDLSGWIVSNVTTMRLMFNNATAFNGDLSTWDMHNVLSTYGMFQDSPTFKGHNLANWRLDRVNQMAFMFRGTASFQQDLCSWTYPESANVTGMFEGTACPSTTDPQQGQNSCFSCV